MTKVYLSQDLKIIKLNTSYGNYSFKIEVLRSGLNGLYKTERSVFEFYLKDIQNKRKEYLSLINKEIKIK